jgi:GAF domain-containing protein
MTRPPVHEDPVTDLDRLAEIAELDVFSERVQARLDDFAQRAATHFDLPIGLVTIVLDGAQWFAGRYGLADWMVEAQGTPVEWSFCATSVRTRREHVVSDARTDAQHKDNPLVTIDGIGCYAGVPLITSRGFVVGNYCVIGTEPHEFTPEEVAELRQMAEDVVAEIEASRQSTADAT